MATAEDGTSYDAAAYVAALRASRASGLQHATDEMGPMAAIGTNAYINGVKVSSAVAEWRPGVRGRGARELMGPCATRLHATSRPAGEPDVPANTSCIDQ